MLALWGGIASATDHLMPCNIVIARPGAGSLVKFVCHGSFALPAATPALGMVFGNPGAGNAYLRVLEGYYTSGLGNPPGSTGYVYKGTSGAFKSPGDCALVLIKSKVIKAVCWNNGNLTMPFPAVPFGVEIQNLLTGDKYCAEFGGTVTRNDANGFRAKNSSAPAACIF
jgi:hypothetical protein